MKAKGQTESARLAPPLDPKEQIYCSRQLGAIAARWDARAPTWDGWVEDPTCHLNEDDAYRRFLEQATAVISRRAVFCRRHGVIDMGCGTGLVLAHVIADFQWGMGVDISPEMIRTARRKHIANARFLVGDCFKLDRLCPPAGAILSRGVLLSHYGPDHGRALLESARSTLVSGGFLLCDFLNKLGQDRSEHRPLGKYFFAPPEVRELAHQAGFEQVRVFGKNSQRVLILLLQE